MTPFRTLLITLTAASCFHAYAADAPVQLIAKKGALIFSDDFERTELGAWKQVCQTFTVADGVMKGSQTRDDHGAVGENSPRRIHPL